MKQKSEICSKAFLSYSALIALIVVCSVGSPADAAVFEEVDGIVAVEAEHFVAMEDTGTRAWYLTTTSNTPDVSPDPDGNHASSASGKAYLEILPDTRTTHHDEPVKAGTNFSNSGGEMCRVSYEIYFNNPGTYHVWVRAHSTGTEDNGVHVGIDDTWPSTGERIQWCKGKRTWTWSDAQRTGSQHCGVPGKISLDVPSAGKHTVMFSMREDGFEMDKFVLAASGSYKPSGAGPDEVVYEGTIDPPPAQDRIVLDATTDFTDISAGEVPYYVDNNRNALAIDASNTGYRDKFAGATTTFSGEEGSYGITITTLTEIDGESTYRLSVNGRLVGTYQNPKTSDDFSTSTHTWEHVALQSGDEIKVESNTHTNGDIEEGSGTAWARGRWTQLDLVALESTARRGAHGRRQVDMHQTGISGNAFLLDGRTISLQRISAIKRRGTQGIVLFPSRQGAVVKRALPLIN